MMATARPTKTPANIIIPPINPLTHAEEAAGGAVALREASALDLMEHPDIFIPIAEGLIATFRDMVDKIESHYDRLMVPFKLAIKHAKAMKDEDTAAWAQANAIVSRKLGDAREMQRRRAAEEAAARQREADAMARRKADEERAEQQRILDELKQEAATKKQARDVEQMQKALAAEPVVVAPAVYVPPVAPAKLDVLSERRDYTAAVQDVRALYAAVQAGTVPGDAIVISANQTWLNKQAARRECADGAPLFPGVVGKVSVTFMRKPLGR